MSAYLTTQELTSAILLAVAPTGARLFRNNIGQWQYSPGKFIRFGLCNPGGSDWIGWTRDGRFLAIEIKVGKDRVTKPQQNFLDQVNAAGGIGIVARSVEDVIEALSH